jgi:hypothetical protein
VKYSCSPGWKPGSPIIGTWAGPRWLRVGWAGTAWVAAIRVEAGRAARDVAPAISVLPACAAGGPGTAGLAGRVWLVPSAGAGNLSSGSGQQEICSGSSRAAST